MSTDRPIEALTPRDLADCVSLARAVGWLDVDSDWRVLHEAALVLGVRQDGVLIGQGALGVYGKAGTIAKMAVAPAFQRQRIAWRIFDRLLVEAQERGLDVLGLVATTDGQPLYERWGFTSAGDVIKMTGTPRLRASASETPCLADSASAARLEMSLGLDRARMLGARFREAVTTASIPAPDGELSGYAMATLQDSRALVGPIMAHTDAEARAMAETVFRAVGGPVRIDVPAEQRSFRDWLRGIGFVEQLASPEMAQGAARLPWQLPQRFALASPAWG